MTINLSNGRFFKGFHGTYCSSTAFDQIWKKCFSNSAGTLSIISRNPPYKVIMPDSQRYPWTLCLIKHELDIIIYNFENWIFCAFLLQEKILELSEFNILKVQYLLIYLSDKVQGYPCESNILSALHVGLLEITPTVPLN